MRRALLLVHILAAGGTSVAAQRLPIAPATSVLFAQGNQGGGATLGSPPMKAMALGERGREGRVLRGGVIGAIVGAAVAVGATALLMDGHCADCSGDGSKAPAYLISAGAGATLGFLLGASLADD